MAKKQVAFKMDVPMLKEMEKVREETGVPISTQVELRLRGYSIVKDSLKPPNP